MVSQYCYDPAVEALLETLWDVPKHPDAGCATGARDALEGLSALDLAMQVLDPPPAPPAPAPPAVRTPRYTPASTADPHEGLDL